MQYILNKTMKNIIFLKVITLFYLFSSSLLIGHSKKKKLLKSHEHGLGVLNIAQEGKVLLLEFEIPGADIVGFEYVAESNDDKKGGRRIKIYQIKNMIVFPASAECSNIKSEVKGK